MIISHSAKKEPDFKFSVLHQIKTGRGNRLAKKDVDIPLNLTTEDFTSLKRLRDNGMQSNPSSLTVSFISNSERKLKRKKRSLRTREVSRKKKADFKLGGGTSEDSQSLVQKNMEILMSSTKRSLVMKQYKDFENNILVQTDHYDIISNQYYFTKLLNALLMRDIEKQAKAFIQHFSLNCQSLLYLKTLKAQKPKMSSQLKEKMVRLAPSESKAIFQLKKKPP